jgi:hypothetical protein
MRRMITTGLAALALTSLVAACGTSSSSESEPKSSQTSDTSTKVPTNGSQCIVGSWSATPEQLQLFTTEPGATETYSTPTGKAKVTFASDGGYTLFFDNVASIRTQNGVSNTIALNGSIGGTYNVRNSAFFTDTTNFNVAVTVDGQPIPPAGAAEFQAALKRGDDEPQDFVCSSTKLTLKNNGTDAVFTRV